MHTLRLRSNNLINEEMREKWMNLDENGEQKQPAALNNGAQNDDSNQTKMETNGNEANNEQQKERDEVHQMVQTAYNAMGQGQNFNRLVKGIRILSAWPPSILAELLVTEEHVNDKVTMHGGCTAALVDILTATSVRLLVPEQPIVSIDLSISYLAPARLGETILLEATCMKAGRSVAFTDATFRRAGSDAQILIKARQQLAILNAQPPPIPKQINGLKIAGDGERKNEQKKQQQIFMTEQFDFPNGGTHSEEMRQIFEQMPSKNNYYRIAKNLEVVHAEPPNLAVKVRLEEYHLNNAGTMHGGFTATLVDIVTSRAVTMIDKCPRSSVDLSVSYLLPAKLGDEIVVEAKCLKIGGMMAFTEATLKRARDGALVAKGKHNMFMLRHKSSPKKSEQIEADAALN